MSEADELFTLRSLFWLGSYQAAINEAHSLQKLKPLLKEEKEEIVFRCYIAMGQTSIVLNEISDSPSVPIGKKAIKLLAIYLENPANKDIVLLQLKEYLSDSNASQNKTLVLIAASIYIYENDLKEAFITLGSGSSIEQKATLVQLYLKIFRSDLAQETLKVMKTLDEDSVLTMLATAWVNLSLANKFQDASYIFEELIDKYGSSPMLLVSLAVCKMHMGIFEEAEASLQEALTKSPSDPDALANLIVVSLHLNRSKEIVSRYKNQLKNKAPNHELVVSLNQFESSFDRAAASIR